MICWKYCFPGLHSKANWNKAELETSNHVMLRSGQSEAQSLWLFSAMPERTEFDLLVNMNSMILWMLTKWLKRITIGKEFLQIYAKYIKHSVYKTSKQLFKEASSRNPNDVMDYAIYTFIITCRKIQKNDMLWKKFISSHFNIYIHMHTGMHMYVYIGIPKWYICIPKWYVLVLPKITGVYKKQGEDDGTEREMTPLLFQMQKLSSNPQVWYHIARN